MKNTISHQAFINVAGGEILDIRNFFIFCPKTAQGRVVKMPIIKFNKWYPETIGDELKCPAT